MCRWFEPNSPRQLCYGEIAQSVEQLYKKKQCNVIYAHVVQLVETADLDSVCCEFESLLGHHIENSMFYFWCFFFYTLIMLVIACIGAVIANLFDD